MTGFGTAYGLIIFANVYALMKAAELFKKNEADDEVSAGIKHLFKILFIGTALIIAAVSTAGLNHLTVGEINADTGLNDNAELTQFRATNNTLYKGMIMTYTAFIAFLLLFVLYMMIRSIKQTNKKRYG